MPIYQFNTPIFMIKPYVKDFTPGWCHRNQKCIECVLEEIKLTKTFIHNSLKSACYSVVKLQAKALIMSVCWGLISLEEKI